MGEKKEQISRKKKVSVRELARQLNLSSGTVSFVLNGRGDEMRIAAATQKRILDAASAAGYSQIEYSHDISRIALYYPVSVRTNLVTLVMNSIHRDVLYDDLEVELVPQPFNYGRLSKRAYLLNKKQCDGAIIVDLSEKDVTFLLHHDFQIPIVLFNHWTSKYSAVCIDSYEAGRKAADIFEGHNIKKAGIISPCECSKEVSLRCIGFLDECRKNGIAVTHRLDVEESAEGGRQAAQRILESQELPEGLFIQANTSAASAVDYFSSYGVRIPEQLKIISFGNTPIAAMTKPSLTNICSPAEEMSSACAKLVLHMVETNDFTPMSMMFPIHVVYRESCKESGRQSTACAENEVNR